MRWLSQDIGANADESNFHTGFSSISSEKDEILRFATARSSLVVCGFAFLFRQGVGVADVGVADEEVADVGVADEEVADEEVADKEVADVGFADEEVAGEADFFFFFRFLKAGGNPARRRSFSSLLRRCFSRICFSLENSIDTCLHTFLSRSVNILSS